MHFIFFIFIIFSPTLFAVSNFHLDLKNEPIVPIKNVTIDNPELVKLGEMLFHDVRLSKNNTISCATCHPLDNAGVDSLAVANGINGLRGKRNTPTVYNSSLNFRQFWDGRVATLQEQSLIPITNPIEMGSNWEEIEQKLFTDSNYKKYFSRAFPNEDRPLSKTNLAEALAAFQQTLLTPDSPFDQYLKGDKNAISEDAKQGYVLFKSYGCSSCHQGAAVGGNLYEKLGVVKEYYVDKNYDDDLGRFEHSGIEEHKHEFKVPGLRNIELTAPYFHNGSIKTLRDAVKIMGKHQLGRVIPDDDIDKILIFLKSLTALKQGVYKK